MSPRPPACSHELRPGTTVCLYCRSAAREAKRRRLGQIAFRVALAAGALVMVAGAASSAHLVQVPGMERAEMLASSGAEAARRADARIASPSESDAPRATTRAEDGRGVQAAEAATGAPSAVAPNGAASLRAVPSPVVAEGVSQLRGGATVLRAGSDVDVRFDVPVMRTRRRDRFEAVVRATLPQVYGALADSALARVPAGALVAGRDLMIDVAAHGLALPAPGGLTLTIRPELRPGHDGPLIIAYRASLAR